MLGVRQQINESAVTEIQDQLVALRELVNKQPRKRELQSTPKNWLKLCASMDALGDSELALIAYEHRRKLVTLGEAYLHVYGALQALFLQQDAVRSIHCALGCDPPKSQVLDDIRDIRNDTVGHPANRKGGTAHFISQITLASTGFSYISATPPAEFESKQVNLLDMIADQREQLTNILKALLSGDQGR
jgi:hypothetical protein